jgi:5,10-methylenetetrahydromethanopterin reductase
MAHFSVALQTNKSFSLYAEAAERIESYGFDALSVYNDLYFQPAWLPLLTIANHTHKILIGPAAVNPFTSHPIQIAGNAALLEQAAPDRTYLGLAKGAWLDSIGLQPPPGPLSLPEALRTIDHLMNHGAAPLDSPYFPVSGPGLQWQVGGPVPVLLGSWGPATIKACLPWIQAVKLGGSAHPGAVHWLTGYLDKLGRPEIDVVIGAVCVVAHDGQAARALARRQTSLYLPVIADLDPSLDLDPAWFARIKALAAVQDYQAVAANISDELLAKFAFAGTPDQVVEQAAALAAAGAARIEFGTPHGLEEAEGLQLLGEQVLPQLRAALGTAA